MKDHKNTYKVNQIHLWHLFWIFLVTQLREVITHEALLWFSIITLFQKWQLLIYRHRSMQAPICWVFGPHPRTRSPSKLSLKFLYQKLYQKSTITSPILMIWQWNFVGWLIWLRWTSTSEIRIIWEHMIDLVASSNKQQLCIYSSNRKIKYFWVMQDFSYTQDAPALELQFLII